MQMKTCYLAVQRMVHMKNNIIWYLTLYGVSIKRCGFGMHCLSASLTYSAVQEKQ